MSLAEMFLPTVEEWEADQELAHAIEMMVKERRPYWDLEDKGNE